MSSKSVVIKALYRDLIRLAGRFDKKRPAKSLIFRMSTGKKLKSPSTIYYSSLLDKILDKGAFFHPDRMDLQFKALVRSEFRKHSSVSHADRIGAGFAVLRKFSSIWSQFERTSYSRSNKKIPKEERFNVSLSSEIYNGVMLCAHPMIHGSMQRSVVLILEHTDKYSYGIILNKRTDHTVQSGILNLPEEMVNIFGNNIVFFGGNVRRLQCIHSDASCGGVSITNCSEPYFASLSLDKPIKKAKKSPIHAKNFHFFVGCCVWKAGALKKEIDEGTWLPVTGEPDKVLQHALTEPIPASYATQSTSNAPSNDGMSLYSDASRREYDSFEGQNETWCRVMRCLGRNTAHFAALSPALDASNIEPVTWMHGSDEEDDEIE
mmetsp:Transcript_2917/g.4428  ORF Transcript_2917/g.4428 Transcript_2917/m.4428 type:complete len:377 (-) Transcript_2917:37-1167(-)|eukprot:CAMPEP_0185037604 /NCGR_PEP_ID=MMETSP1103-20130426/32285_1 /TAXON_ID=36769 /ORGANISM="Paraphysomonas bandaiensis, Strain Caron Lab Isolate" /LENGTH=376 /DNA_ID=CAMNT_0027575669 /DNA_START=146 /DNA_END=1276 /DNA_ORIENTATION=-